MEVKDKKRLVLIISGVLFMVAIVAVATYAYFTVSVQNNFSETKVSSKLDNIGTVSLLPETTEMTLNLTIDDMLLKDDSVIYYATKDGATTLQSSEVIAKASVSGEGIFNCTYDITMDATGENNMYEAVQNANQGDQVILWVDGVKYDFGTTDLFPKTMSGEIVGLTEGVSHDIVAELRVINTIHVVQDYLKGTDINITFNISNFKCNTTKESDNTKYIKNTSPENISTELIDGLYRYQGTQEQVTNNYICWGTMNKEECLATDSEYLYRIIGFTPDGQIKIIKNKLHQAFYTYSPEVTYAQNTVWSESNLLHDTKNYIIWDDMLVSKKWKYGDITQETFSNLTTIDEALAVEKKFNNVVSSNTGLMSMSDFFNHDTCYSDSTLNYVSKCTDGWLLLNNLDESYDRSTVEWSYVRLNGTQMALTYNGVGGVNVANITNSLNYRQVAYIAPNGSLTLKTGTGTITDPYMFSN